MKNHLKFIYVKSIDEVLTHALGIELPEPYTSEFLLNKDSKTEIGFDMKDH